jgi:hypothetical protein
MSRNPQGQEQDRVEAGQGQAGHKISLQFEEQCPVPVLRYNFVAPTAETIICSSLKSLTTLVSLA